MVQDSRRDRRSGCARHQCRAGSRCGRGQAPGGGAAPRACHPHRALEGRLRQDARATDASGCSCRTAARSTTPTRVASAVSPPSSCATGSGISNRKYAKQLGKRPLTVYIIPTTRDKLLSGVVAGLGDIAAGNLTVTDERSQIVDFVAPADVKGVNEIVVTGPKAPRDQVGRRSRRQDRARAAGHQLPREPRRAERALQEGRQAAGQARAPPRRARGRGHAGDGERGPARHRRRGRLEGEDLGADPAEASRSSRRTAVRDGRPYAAGRSARTARSSRPSSMDFYTKSVREAGPDQRPPGAGH